MVQQVGYVVSLDSARVVSCYRSAPKSWQTKTLIAHAHKQW